MDKLKHAVQNKFHRIASVAMPALLQVSTMNRWAAITMRIATSVASDTMTRRRMK